MIRCTTVEHYQSLYPRLAAPIGFVPTLGGLHEGHLALIRRARAENATVVVSVYLNPTQFNNPDDLATYPADLDEDIRLLENEKVDVLWMPSHEEMYPEGLKTRTDWWPGRLAEVLEGQYRPGHFEGVITVVRRLFDIIRPHRAYFGMKDYQQLKIVQRLAADLYPGLEIVPVPTVRDSDGLALSSRNRRLSPAGRRTAAHLPRTLHSARRRLLQGDPVSAVLEEARRDLQRHGIEVEYFELVDAETLEPVRRILPGNYLLCTAVYVEGVRLIDNVPVAIK